MSTHRETHVLWLANPGRVGELLLECGPLPMGQQKEVRLCSALVLREERVSVRSRAEAKNFKNEFLRAGEVAQQ